jgi:hypothetical protein
MTRETVNDFLATLNKLEHDAFRITDEYNRVMPFEPPENRFPVVMDVVSQGRDLLTFLAHALEAEDYIIEKLEKKLDYAEEDIRELQKQLKAFQDVCLLGPDKLAIFCENYNKTIKAFDV